jgi:Protein of unknown function (DUF2849)
MPSVITANRLRSGDVVYLARNGAWVRTLDDAVVIDSADVLSTCTSHATAAVARNEVVSVYEMDVRLVDGKPVPVSVRENIRAAHGPSV